MYPALPIPDQNLFARPIGELEHIALSLIRGPDQDRKSGRFRGREIGTGEFLSKEIDDNAAKNFASGFKFAEVACGCDAKLATLVPENSDMLAQKMGNEDFKIRVPEAGYQQSKGLNPKFVLVLDQIIFSRDLETYRQSMASAPATMNVGGKSVKIGAAPMTESTNQKSLSMGLNYLIYDCEVKTVVGYGFARGEKAFTFAMIRSDWYAAMEKFFAAIWKFTPVK